MHRTFASKLKLLYTNVNSYTGKRYIINNTIERYKINCALFVESKTKPENNTNYRNWNIIRQDGNIANTNIRGGSLVQAYPNLKLGKKNAPRINNPLNNCLHFTMAFNGEILHTFLVYIHPTSQIEETIFTMAAQCKYAIIIGDFNCNTPLKRKQLSNFVKNSQFVKADISPTFIMPNNQDSTPDVLLYTQNISNNISKIDVLPDIGSDHLSILIEMDLKQNTPTMPTIKYKFEKCNIEKVNKEMMTHITTNEDVQITSSKITEFNTKLTQTVIEHTPTSSTNYYTHELPPFIIKLIKYKRRLYRQYRLNPDADVKKQINDISKNIHHLIGQYRQHKWIETCEEIGKSKGRNFYQKINKVSKYKTRHSIPDIEENYTVYHTEEEKSHIFAENLEQTYKESFKSHYNAENYKRVNDWYDKYFQKPISTPNIDLCETTYFEILNKQKNTCPGEDNIPWNVIKKLEYPIHMYIIEIYKYCINYNHFPQEWKKGRVIVFPKPNTDHQKVSNYRPITLLPALGKIFEKIIRNQIIEHSGHNIPQHQFGFKKQTSTLHPLTILTSNIQTAKLNGYKSATLFIDVKKAFDSVWHRGLLFKLYQLELPDYIIHLIRQYLENRTLQVKIGNALSNTFKLHQSVPQGSPLSPTLYNLYVHDFGESTAISQRDSYILQYADDTALVAHGRNLQQTISTLQTQLNRCELWLSTWRLEANPLKSQLLIFHHKIKNTSPSVTLSNHRILPSSTAKYLGINLDNKLNFKHHTNLLKKRTVTRSKYFRHLTYKQQGIGTHAAAKIYKSICRPLLEYGHTIYLNSRHPTNKNLQVTETTSLRIITKIRHPNNSLHNPPNNLLYEKTKIQPILQRLKVLSTKFAQKEHNMEIIKPMLLSRQQQHASKYRFPEQTIEEHLHLLQNCSSRGET